MGTGTIDWSIVAHWKAQGVDRGAKKTQKSLEGVDRSARSLKKNLAAFGITAAVATAALLALSVSTMKFGTSIREVGTLIGGQADELAKIEAASISLSATYGTSATDQAKSFYQAISAGASSAAEATDILDVANRLAIGGVTDVTTGVDGLTSMLNSYGLSASNAESVSDALFVAMKLGKTTVGELSATIGGVTPIAAQAGVGFESVLAAVAALTKGGIATSIAMAGLRAMLMSIIKPAKESADYAKELGIEFNVQALQAKGLEGVLKDVAEATGGEADQIARLFTGTEALTPALALMGKSAGDFAVGLQEMETRSGATAEAFAIMSEDMAFQMKSLRSSIAAEIFEITSALAGKLLPAVTRVNENLSEIKTDALDALGVAIDIVKVAASILAALLIAKGAIAFAAYAGSVTVAEAALFGFGIAIDLATKKVVALSATLKLAMASLGPAGWVAIGVGAIVTAFVLWKRAWKDVDDLIVDSSMHLSDWDKVLDDVNKATKDQRKEMIELTKAKIDNVEATLLAIEAEHKFLGIQGLLITSLQKLFEAGKTGALQGELIGLQNKLRDLEINVNLQDGIDDAAEAAADLATNLDTAAAAIKKLTPEEIKIKIDGILKSAHEVQAAVAEIAREELKLIIDAEVKDIEVTVTTVQAGSGALGPAEQSDPQSLIDEYAGASTMVGMAVEGLDAEVGNMIVALDDLVLAFLQDAPSGDLIGLIAQAAHALRMYRKGKNEEKKNTDKAIDLMLNFVRKMGNEVAAAAGGINEEYDALIKSMQEQLDKLVGREQRIAAGVKAGRKGEYDLIEIRGKVAEMTEALAKVEAQRNADLLAATRAIQVEGFQGLISMFEQLGVHLADTVDGELMLQNLEQLRMEMEIMNYRIQLSILAGLGTVAQETLDWIESMIDTVEAGLRSGDLTLGGEPARTGGGRRPSGGTNPLEAWNALVDKARDFAGIQSSTVTEMVDHFAEMREHSGRMRGDSEERAARSAQILELERAAAESYGQTLLERVAQATGNEEMLRDLELIRYEAERASTLAEIARLIATGNLTEDMVRRLRDAAGILEDFDFTVLVDKWDEALQGLRGFEQGASDAQRLWDAWAAANQAALETSTTTEELLGKYAEAWDLAVSAAHGIAFSMIDSLATAVGSEEDMRKVAILRHQMEIAQYRMQAEILRPFLDPETYDWLVDLIDQFAAMDPTTGIGDGGFGSGVTNAIDDQTDRLERALEALGDLMNDLMLGDLSPLSQEQQYNTAMARYQDLQARARAGDVEAMEELQNFIPQFLQLVRDYSGGVNTSLYANIWAGVMADLAAITGMPNPAGGLNVVPLGGSGTGSASGNILGSQMNFRPDLSPMVAEQAASRDQSHTDAERTHELLEELVERQEAQERQIAELMRETAA